MGRSAPRCVERATRACTCSCRRPTLALFDLVAAVERRRAPRLRVPLEGHPPPRSEVPNQVTSDPGIEVNVQPGRLGPTRRTDDDV